MTTVEMLGRCTVREGRDQRATWPRCKGKGEQSLRMLPQELRWQGESPKNSCQSKCGISAMQWDPWLFKMWCLLGREGKPLAHTPMSAGPVPWLKECDHLLAIHKRYSSIRMGSGWLRVFCWSLERSLGKKRWVINGIGLCEKATSTGNFALASLALAQSWNQFPGGEEQTWLVPCAPCVTWELCPRSRGVSGWRGGGYELSVQSFLTLQHHKVWPLGSVLSKLETFVVELCCSPSLWSYLKISL